MPQKLRGHYTPQADQSLHAAVVGLPLRLKGLWNSTKPTADSSRLSRMDISLDFDPNGTPHDLSLLAEGPLPSHTMNPSHAATPRSSIHNIPENRTFDQRRKRSHVNGSRWQDIRQNLKHKGSYLGKPGGPMILTYGQRHVSNPQRLYPPYESLFRGNASKIANAKSAPIYELYLSR